MSKTDLLFTHLPPVYVLSSQLSSQEQHEVEDALTRGGAPLTYDINEARVIISSLSKSRRVRLELQWKGLCLAGDEQEEWRDHGTSALAIRRRDSKGKEATSSQTLKLTGRELKDGTAAFDNADEFPEGIVVVVTIEWFRESCKSNSALPLAPYTVLRACISPSLRPHGKKKVAAAEDLDTATVTPSQIGHGNLRSLMSKVEERARTGPRSANSYPSKRQRVKEAADRDFVGRSFSSSTQTAAAQSGSRQVRPTHLLHQTTSEHEEMADAPLPPMPEWVLHNKIYSCERATPLDSPNKDFVTQLKKIKRSRLLTSDEIGVRAYSTSIAALLAYPYKIRNAQEILALPGCDHKVAHLFKEYRSNDGHLDAVAELEADPVLSILNDFYEIWGVGAITAREFYYDKGWHDRDDIVEFGWSSLSRVQQIGLKYYDEFQLKISRGEVETIAATIRNHAQRVTDQNMKMVIVGGYRRGKPESGDVDIILSHPDKKMTYDLVSQVVKSLECEGFITHTLTLGETNTKRNQETLPINPLQQGRSGFDTLDKALVVWQDPEWPSKKSDLAANPNAKNPNPHRRVDIIISPWRTIGCAVAGWTSGTTFQRDLRRYVKKVKGWKFDSSGVRDRATGAWLDLEGWRDEATRCQDWPEAERRLFAGLGLEYREPWDRCTG